MEWPGKRHFPRVIPVIWVGLACPRVLQNRTGFPSSSKLSLILATGSAGRSLPTFSDNSCILSSTGTSFSAGSGEISFSFDPTDSRLSFSDLQFAVSGKDQSAKVIPCSLHKEVLTVVKGEKRP